jgi:catechol 2,3-dioxygenase-like lactoylglutathione lyase family enzyme
MTKIVLWVSDMDAQIAFYSKLLSLDVVARESGFTELSYESNSVLLHQLPDEYRAIVPLTAQLAPQDEVAIKPVFIVANLARARQSVHGTLGSVQSGENTYGDSTYLDVVDPEGNVIQIEQQS